VSYEKRWSGRWARAADWAERLCLIGALTLPIVITGRASAEPADITSENVEGHVVAFELGDVVVDIAGDRGATTGAVLELWRPLTLKHPVTGQMVSDRFLIGRLRLTQVRGALALAHPEGKLVQPAQPGDIVVLHRAVAAAAHPATAKPAVPAPVPATPAVPTPFGVTPAEPTKAEPVKPEPPKVEPAASDASVATTDADAAEVSALFEHLRGSGVAARVLAYEGYVKRHPRGKYAVVLYEEAAQLRRLVAFDNGAPDKSEGVLKNFAPPREARSHTPLRIAVEVSAGPVGAVLHSRNSGEVAYRSTPMTRVGDGYFSATIEADRLNAPRLEYFIEGVDADGNAVIVVGNAMEPQNVTVTDVPMPKPPARYPATVTLSTDYADWNNFKGNDVVWQTEGSVGMRFQDVGLRAARTGFGVYRGVGGSLAELDEQKLSGRRVGLTYGYLEGEFGLSYFTSIIGRVVIGLEDDGVNGGAQALLRIGNDRDTNLTIGGEVLGGIGLRGITELQLATFPRVPILFRTEVTNQPAGVATGQTSVVAGTGVAPNTVSIAQGEVGARAIAQVGYRFLPDLVVAVRGSYQGRTINHAGPGFGGAVSYQW
jgi:hypothetical protein